MGALQKCQEYNDFIDDLKLMCKKQEYFEIENGLNETRLMLCRNKCYMASVCFDSAFEYIDQENQNWSSVHQLHCWAVDYDEKCWGDNCAKIHEKIGTLIDSVFEKKSKLVENYLSAKLEIVHLYGVKLGVMQYETELQQIKSEIVKQKLLRTMSKRHPNHVLPLFD
jgi:hypothetical protein